MRILTLLATTAVVTVTTVVAWGCSMRTAPTSSGTAPTAPSIVAPAAVLSVDDQVREAVFKYQFTNNASGMKQRAPVYFLSIGEVESPRDPSTTLMARFANHQPPVEPISRARITFEDGVLHRDTGERGLVFRVTVIKWVSDDVADVEGGYYEGNLSSSGNTYRVERTGGVWVVMADKMHWIS